MFPQSVGAGPEKGRASARDSCKILTLEEFKDQMPNVVNIPCSVHLIFTRCQQIFLVNDCQCLISAI